MSSIQIADQTFIAAAPEAVGSAVADQSRWREWWPQLRLEVREARGEKGVRWRVDGLVRGTMEVWLKPEMDGTLLHFFLHAEPSSCPDGDLLRYAPPHAPRSAGSAFRAPRRGAPWISSIRIRREPPHSSAALRKLTRKLRVAGKEMSFELKDRHEAGKTIGEASVAPEAKDRLEV